MFWSVNRKFAVIIFASCVTCLYIILTKHAVLLELVLLHLILKEFLFYPLFLQMLLCIFKRHGFRHPLAGGTIWLFSISVYILLWLLLRRSCLEVDLIIRIRNLFLLEVLLFILLVICSEILLVLLLLLLANLFELVLLFLLCSLLLVLLLYCILSVPQTIPIQRTFK